METDHSTPSSTSIPDSSSSGSDNSNQKRLEIEGLKEDILNHLVRDQAHWAETATRRDWWQAVSLTVRGRIVERGCDSHRCRDLSRDPGNERVKRVYYLSLEYLMGRLLVNNLVSLGLLDSCRIALKEMGQDLEDIAQEGQDLGLGNGGLGRLAACFMDSLATLNLPAVGYGINYEYGLFRQKFIEGQQAESPDEWRRFGSPWEICRPENAVEVPLYGRVEMKFDDCGNGRVEWVDTRSILGVPWHIAIAGYGDSSVNFLCLWESKAAHDFDLETFNRGGYVEAVREKALSETVSKVLYPNDSTEAGKELRLIQQYFFVTCSLHDIIRRFRNGNVDWNRFPDEAAIQLNDTHPAIAVVELMRILVDKEHLPWEQAWEICQKTFAYTNHTLLPEALEKWSVPLFEKILPRHLQIIYEINRRFLEEVVEKRWPGDEGRMRELSIIEEGSPKMVRMAYLSVVGSHTTNGVAALHTELLKSRLFKGFHELFPERFQNKTNGITPRRWLKACNEGLSALIDRSIGTGWVSDLDQLRSLEAFADDASFQEEFMAIKHANKERLAHLIDNSCGLKVDPHALFDVQIKRLHEYKRQHLNLLNILTQYRRLLQNPDLDLVPRVYVFGAKAAPGYVLAKQIIYAINSVATVINADERIQGKIKVAFIPNYSVSAAEVIIPGSDLSEQISTAGKEASGTGNMKLALNGALTIGTLDGANVEIREEVGEENIFIFGLTVEEIDEARAKGYNPYDLYWSDSELRDVIDWLTSSAFAPKDSFHLLRDSLLSGGDPFFVLADYRAYLEAQSQVDVAFRDRSRWAKMAILNTARIGKFSSDRTIREYAKEIWNLTPVQG